jgi:dihydrofolate reductase
MGKLLYGAMTSLDGYIEDEKGRFDWAEPSEEVHAFVNDIERRAGTHLYGRRMYETLAVWETDASLTSQPGVIGDFAAIWQAADKVVYSTTLAESVPTRRTTVERSFDPDAVRDLKASSDDDLMIGGAALAAAAFGAGLIDELHLFLSPIVVGGGKPALPDGVRIDLELAGHRRFANGTAYLHYLLR